MSKNNKTTEELVKELKILKEENTSLQAKYEKDTAERKQIEEALSYERNMLRTLIDTLPDSIHIYIKDNKSRYLINNRAHLRSIGAADQKDVLGKSMFDFFPLEKAEQFFSSEQEIVRTKKPLLNIEGLVYDNTFKEQRWHLTTKVPLSDSNGNVIALVGTCLDITQQKQNEKELKNINEELLLSKSMLEKNLNQKNILVEELTSIKEKLEKTNSEKDKFFSIIAHDLKSPFSGFIGLTELMAENVSSFSPAELSQLSIEMNTNAKNLFKLLRNLLDWARMQQDSINFNPKDISLSELVSQNIDLIVKRGEQKGIALIIEISKDHKICADEAMVNSILRNLLSNAVKFTKAGGRVSVSSKEVENHMLEISITDSGIGMSEELSQKLFKVEEKVGRKGTEGEDSTGLGLLLCKEFVEKHGGRIWMESEEGKGSTFSFSLPISR